MDVPAYPVKCSREVDEASVELTCLPLAVLFAKASVGDDCISGAAAPSKAMLIVSDGVVNHGCETGVENGHDDFAGHGD